MAGRGDGLRARLARIPGETPKGVLARPLVLPAVLGTVGWTEEAVHSEYDTIRGGQFSQPAMGPATARQLRALDDVESLALWWDAPWLVERGLDPDRVYRDLFAVLRSRKPVELLLSLQLGDPHPLLRMNVTLRSISPQMRQHEADTMYYTVRLKEWRHASASRRGEGRGSKLPTTHKLTATDTLYSLAEHYYHSAAGADAIARANSLRSWGKKTALVKHARLKVGSKLKIPKVAIASTGARGG